MEQFYSRYFGFKRARVFNPKEKNEFIILRLGNTCIELFSADEKKINQSRPITGFKHLAFEVADLEDFVKKLNSKGIVTEHIIDYSHVIPGFRICFFSDPEGNRIEIMEGYKDQF